MFETQIQALIDERASAVEDVRAMYDEAEKRDNYASEGLTADEQAKEARVHAAVADLDQRIKNTAKKLKDQRDAADALSALNLPALGTDGANPPAGDAAVSKRDQFNAWLRADETEARSMPAGFALETRDDVALGTTTATDGQELVHSSMHNQLWEHMVHESAIMQTNATVLRTTQGNDLLVPKTTSYSAASIVAEAGTVGRDSPQTDRVTIKAYKLGFIVEVDHELIQDEEFDVVDFVLRQGGAALGRGADTYFIAGTGTNQPQGVINATASGETVAVAGAANHDFLVDTMFSVIPPARAGASWLFNDVITAGIMKVKDGDGRYLWQPSHQAGQPDTLLGRPAYSDPNLSDQAGEVVGVFGNLAGFYTRFAGGFRVERSDHALWSTDQVSFRFLTRIGSAIVDDTAFRTIAGA